MCYSSPPVYKVQPDPAIFAYHPVSWRKPAPECFKYLHSLVSAVEFEQINTSAQSLRGTKAYFEQILPKDLKRLSGRMAVITRSNLFPIKLKQVFTLVIKKLFMLESYSLKNPVRSPTIENHSYIIARKPVSPRYDRTTSIFK